MQDSLTLHDAQAIMRFVSLAKLVEGGTDQPTWIPCVTVSAKVITSNIVNQLLKNFLVARLLALAQGRSHVSKAKEICGQQLAELVWTTAPDELVELI